jgi:hypothetical protein
MLIDGKGDHGMKLITYAHKAAPHGTRFRQDAAVDLPFWAVDVREELPPVLVNLHYAATGAPYATGVDLLDVYPDPEDYARALHDLTENPNGFMDGGGAAPVVYVRPFIPAS